jgi:hypothetical protein
MKTIEERVYSRNKMNINRNQIGDVSVYRFNDYARKSRDFYTVRHLGIEKQ